MFAKRPDGNEVLFGLAAYVGEIDIGNESVIVVAAVDLGVDEGVAKFVDKVVDKAVGLGVAVTVATALSVNTEGRERRAESTRLLVTTSSAMLSEIPKPITAKATATPTARLW